MQVLIFHLVFIESINQQIFYTTDPNSLYMWSCKVNKPLPMDNLHNKSMDIIDLLVRSASWKMFIFRNVAFAFALKMLMEKMEHTPCVDQLL